MFDNLKNIHFIGIGGSGISALAALAMAQGANVTGSDISASSFSDSLIKRGARVNIGHKLDNLSKNTDLVIYSEAIDKTLNPEYLAAMRFGIRTISYFQALGEFSKTKKTIVVAGTHGKTTTASMLGQALIECGFDPTIIVGAQVPAFANNNIYIGKGEWFVVEGCEYRRSFLHLEPFGVVALNCEPDHLDYYKDEEDYKKAFSELFAKIHPQGFLVANGQDSNLKILARGFKGNLIFVEEKIPIKLRIPGEFNVWNATHAFFAAKSAGADPVKIRQSLAAFSGSCRRMEIKGIVNGIAILDDYGHHPTEVRLTLEAVREKYKGRRLICVFQPHQFSRTWQFLEQFKTAFADADFVIVPNIYEARDSQEDKQKINAEKFVEALSLCHPNAQWGKDFETTKKLLKAMAHSGDVVLVMGAGDIVNLANDLPNVL